MKTRITITNVYTLILESNKILSKATINSKQVTQCEQLCGLWLFIELKSVFLKTILKQKMLFEEHNNSRNLFEIIPIKFYII